MGEKKEATDLQQQLNYLVRLQAVDLEVGQIQKIKDDCPASIEKLNRELEKKRGEIKKEEESLEVLQKEIIQEEIELDVETEKIRKSEGKMEAVKSNKEYHAASKEIKISKDLNGKREEEMIVLFDQIETAKKSIKQKEADLLKNFQEFERKKKETEKKLKKSEKEINSHLLTRKAIFEKIWPELAKKYQVIKKKRQGIAVVPTSDNHCNGCNMNIPPQLFNQIQKKEELIFCPYCNRILCWEDHSGCK